MQKSVEVWPGPVDDKGLSFDQIHGDKTPVPAVQAVVPIVSHDKKASLGDGDRPEIGFCIRQGHGFLQVGVSTVFIIIEFSVDINFSVNHLKRFAWKTDNTFNEILAFVHRIDKHDYIVSFGCADRDERFVHERDFDSVNKFVDKNVVADHERWDH